LSSFSVKKIRGSSSLLPQAVCRDSLTRGDFSTAALDRLTLRPRGAPCRRPPTHMVLRRCRPWDEAHVLSSSQAARNQRRATHVMHKGLWTAPGRCQRPSCGRLGTLGGRRAAGRMATGSYRQRARHRHRHPGALRTVGIAPGSAGPHVCHAEG